ncbi:MAG: acyltransferase family protein [Candidatus Ornithomonoglobus sp.]
MKKYDNLDGLRTFAAIGIILMHIMANTDYQLPQNIIINIIGRAGLLVELFFIISGFGMCCGYYERVKNGEISLDSFFKKRYLKILPFFAFLVCIDIIISGFTSKSLIEGFSDVTLMYGLFPNCDIEVIGVGWALGVIFAFYILFPFFVFMIWNKKRGWFFLGVTMVINYICVHYFGGTICNIARWMCYFAAGGILYLYKDNIENTVSRFRIIFLIAVIVISVFWYISPNEIGGIDISTIKLIILFSSWICYAISVKSKILANPFTKFMSNISFEIYLAHMMIFRVVEKLELLHLFKSNVISYMSTSIIVLVAVTAFASVMKRVINKTVEVLKGKEYGRKKA